MKQSPDSLDQLFHLALQQAVENRRDWLQRHCADDTENLNELLSLLDAHEQAGDFMEQPLSLKIDQLTENDLIGCQLGAYQIDRLIAHGGIGRVYHAYRNDGEYEQEVAVKLIESTHINPALLKHERQILADLHHPNIVSLIDGGTLPEGIPYLIMEFIQGQPIHQYVREKKLSERQVVSLFCTLLKVVSQIHQYGVIHCDIKPDNVLITTEGDVKLLDFGVAHLFSITSRAPEHAAQAITPEYASPQRHNETLPEVDDDIYSLGVLLGVMLSSLTPKTQYSAKEGFSVNLSAIENELNTELKAIFNKAIASDSKARYQSVNKLLDDLHCWLDQMPLQAMGNDSQYYLKKFLQRNIFSVTASFISLVVITIMILFWQVQKTRAEQTQSMVMAQVNLMLKELDDRTERLSGSTLARVATVESVLERLKILNHQQPADLHIKQAMADALMKLGDLLGHPFHLHLNQFERSRKHLSQALLLYQEIFTENPDSFPDAMRLVKTERMLAAQTAFVDRQPEQALQVLYIGLDRLKNIKRSSLRHNTQLAIQYLAISHLLIVLDQLPEAADGYTKAEALLQYPDDSQNEYEREHNQRSINFFRDEKAAFILANKEYPKAKIEFQQILLRHEDKPFWLHRRRSARAYYALGCIDLINLAPLSDAIEQLHKAHDIMHSLKNKYPAALTLQWELNRYAPIDTDLAYSRDAWIDTFDCHNAHRIMNPPVIASH